MILVGSANASIGIDAGWQILAAGGTALDAVEATARAVEDDPDDHTVGYAGYPNLVGDVELDASIMDGSTRRAGAVGALRGVDPRGNHAAATTKNGTEYVLRTAELDAPELRLRTVAG